MRPSPIPPAIDAALAHHRAGRLEQAESLYRNILARQPDEAGVLHLLGLVLHQRGEDVAAAELIERALRINRREPLFHFNLGQVRKAQGAREEAAACYRRALQLKPDYAEAHNNLGNLLRELGRPQEAVVALRRACALRPQDTRALANLAAVLTELGNHAEAIGRWEDALRADPGCREALMGLGLAHRAQGDTARAGQCLRRALELGGDSPETLRRLARELGDLGDKAAAEQAWRRIVELQPADAAAWNDLATLLLAARRPEETITCARRALDLAPALPQARNNLGVGLLETGRPAEAAEEFRRALALAPELAPAHANLGLALHQTGEFLEAETAYREALRLQPDFPQALGGLGVLLFTTGRHAEAESLLRRAIDLEPRTAEHYSNLGRALAGLGRSVEAIAHFRHAVELAPESWEALNNLAGAFMEQCDFPGARQALEHALRLAPRAAGTRSNLLFLANYDPGLTPQAVFAEYRRYHAECIAPLQLAAQPFANPPEPQRRLRIGYVSPDFRQHSVRHFIEPLLARHDRAGFELFAYADLQRPDKVTERIRGYVDHFEIVTMLPDDALSARIRADGIDILVDLAGHTHGNRLGVFARRPAPVQATWLGFGSTTGLPEMDYFIADRAFVPDEAAEFFAERLLRLPRCTFAYRPDPEMPEVGPLPALAAGHVTFGSFSRAVRLNDRVVALWSQLLHRVPGARLVLNALAFADESGRELLARRFAAEGIARERLDLVYTTPQPTTWAAYGGIDIALDPFPHNGGTTTIEALWMGVPVVSLADRPPVGRLGATILGSAGLGDWVADSPEQYLEIAGRWARNLGALAALRENLRARIAASPLCDEAAFARDFEGALRQAWGEWCERNSGPDSPGARLLRGRALAAEGIALKERGDLAGAAERLRGAVATCPEDPEAHNALGNALAGLGRHAEATTCYRDALAVDPRHVKAHYNLGIALYHLGEIDAAIAEGRSAIALAPGFADAHLNLGVALLRAGRPAEARAALLEALRLDPGLAHGHNALGLTYKEERRFRESEAAYREAIRLMPAFAEAHSNLGNDLRAQGRLAEARAALEQAIALRPDFAPAHSNLAGVLQDLCLYRESRSAFERALQLDPGLREAHSNLLFLINYDPEVSPEDAYARYREWAEACIRGISGAERTERAPEPAAGRRLRLGYVSPDLRGHVVSLFIEPLLAHHDHERFEVHAYADLARPDETSARLRGYFDRWTDTGRLSDATLAERIRADGIDILVDLAGHTAGNRLPVFARRPAPLQVTYLGFGCTTGLSAIDGFLADGRFVPPGEERWFSERVLRLPRCMFAYRPPEGMPAVGPLPALGQGRVTFGCFSRTVRLNRRVIALWSELLARLPAARLVLNAQPFVDAPTRELFHARFAEHGIAAERVELVYTSPQPATWAAYNGIDIALDPFPHNAGTTTFEALWMGVPVVSLADRPPLGRFGATILEAAGLGQWVADDPGQYLAIAERAARDLPALAALRAGLRARIQASPLRDERGFARAVERALEGAWEECCAATNRGNA